MSYNFTVRILRKTSGHINIVRVLDSYLVLTDTIYDNNQIATKFPDTMINCPNSAMYNKKLCIVMEYCSGGDLSNYIKNRRCADDNNSSNLHSYFSEDEVLSLFVQLISGLHHIHDCGVMHRDLKSSNIMLASETLPILKLGDFGISKVLSTRSVDASTLVGTPYYLSPEICRGKRYNRSSDMWSCGCILYELLTLERCFTGACLPALVLKIIRGSWSLPEHISGKYSKNIIKLLHDLLSTEPKDRPSTGQIWRRPFIQNHTSKMTCDMKWSKELRNSLQMHIDDIPKAAPDRISKLRARDYHLRSQLNKKTYAFDNQNDIKDTIRTRLNDKKILKEEEKRKLEEARNIRKVVNNAHSKISKSQDKNEAFFLNQKSTDAGKADVVVVFENSKARSAAPHGENEEKEIDIDQVENVPNFPEVEIYVPTGKIDEERVASSFKNTTLPNEHAGNQPYSTEKYSVAKEKKDCINDDVVTDIQEIKRVCIEHLGVKLYHRVRNYLLHISHNRDAVERSMKDEGFQFDPRVDDATHNEKLHSLDYYNNTQNTLQNLLGRDKLHYAFMIHQTIL